MSGEKHIIIVNKEHLSSLLSDPAVIHISPADLEDFSTWYHKGLKYIVLEMTNIEFGQSIALLKFYVSTDTHYYNGNDISFNLKIFIIPKEELVMDSSMKARCTVLNG